MWIEVHRGLASWTESRRGRGGVRAGVQVSAGRSALSAVSECNWLSAQAVYGCQPPEGNGGTARLLCMLGVLHGHLGMETRGETAGHIGAWAEEETAMRARASWDSVTPTWEGAQR